MIGINTSSYKNQYHYSYRINQPDQTSTTCSKLESFKLAGSDIWKIDLDWNHDFWKIQNWSEPAESIDVLQQNLARRIASEFKKIYVLFSGGWDSWTVVNSFYKAGIKIHGLISIDRTYILREEISAIRSRINHIRRFMYPEIDVRWLTWKADDATHVYHKNLDDWIYVTPSLTPRLGRVDRETQFQTDRIAAAAALDDDSIIIDGIDKPKLDLIDGVWQARFNDRPLEWFRNSPTFPFFINTIEPRIHIKQCHMLKKYMISRGIDTHNKVHDSQSWNISGEYEQFNLAIGRDNPEDWILTSPYIKNFDDSQEAINLAIKDLRKYSENHAEHIVNIWKTGLEKLKYQIAEVATGGFYFAPAALSPAYPLS